ncbi:MAG: tRNA (adenosine(37)-N6)-dimethylallyltransferase MiaA [Chlorobium sp.]
MPSSDSLQPPVIVILGPTASGKSRLAVALAKKIGGEIISADSRQIYRELDIGSAKPSSEELGEVTHHFINENNIGEPYSAGDFASEAVRRIQKIHEQGKRAVVAGGSTLYLEGLLEGFAELPPAHHETRARLLAELDRFGSEHLYEQLCQKDPEQAATLDPTKSQRLIRSLEIIERSGKSVTELQALGKMQRSSLRFLVYGLEMPRALLYDRINRRSDEMMQAGLFHEAEVLYRKYRDLISERRTGALQSVGYQELFRHFQGVIELPEAVRLIQQHTRNYAKRQLTFFRNRLTVNWVAAPENRSDVEKLTAALEKPLLNDRSVR